MRFFNNSYNFRKCWYFAFFLAFFLFVFKFIFQFSVLRNVCSLVSQVLVECQFCINCISALPGVNSVPQWSLQKTTHGVSNSKFCHMGLPLFIFTCKMKCIHSIQWCMVHIHYTGRHTHTHPFNGPLSGTTQVSQYQKGKTNLDFTEARDSE